MKFFDPWGFDYIVILGMALKLFHFGLINMSFNVVTKVRKEKYLPFTVPKERMVQDIFKH